MLIDGKSDMIERRRTLYGKNNRRKNIWQIIQERMSAPALVVARLDFIMGEDGSSRLSVLYRYGRNENL